MTNFIIGYAACGILFTIIEHFSYDWGMLDKMSPIKVILNILHQIIHYSRCMIVWPWYLVEDLLLIIDNKILGDDDESPPNDGGIAS